MALQGLMKIIDSSLIANIHDHQNEKTKLILGARKYVSPYDKVTK
jgi:hypothetical protein